MEEERRMRERDRGMGAHRDQQIEYRRKNEQQRENGCVRVSDRWVDTHTHARARTHTHTHTHTQSLMEILLGTVGIFFSSTSLRR